MTGDGLWLAARKQGGQRPRQRGESNEKHLDHPDEIRDRYFYDVPGNVPDEFPTVNRACLLMAAFDGQTEDLTEDLWSWTFEPLRYQDLFHSSERRAAFLKFAGEVYLFTFDDLSSFEAGIAEIKQTCRRSH